MVKMIGIEIDPLILNQSSLSKAYIASIHFESE